MIISIRNEEGEVTNFDVNAIEDEQKRNEANVIIRLVIFLLLSKLWISLVVHTEQT
jgi:hypothetical protein